MRRACCERCEEAAAVLTARDDVANGIAGSGTLEPSSDDDEDDDESEDDDEDDEREHEGESVWATVTLGAAWAAAAGVIHLRMVATGPIEDRFLRVGDELPDVDRARRGRPGGQRRWPARG